MGKLYIIFMEEIYKLILIYILLTDLCFNLKLYINWCLIWFQNFAGGV